MGCPDIQAAALALQLLALGDVLLGKALALDGAAESISVFHVLAFRMVFKG